MLYSAGCVHRLGCGWWWLSEYCAGEMCLLFARVANVARLAGLEPTASASAGLRSIRLSYKRPDTIAYRNMCVALVPKEGFEPTHP